MRPIRSSTSQFCLAYFLVVGWTVPALSMDGAAQAVDGQTSLGVFVADYCVGCHDSDESEGGLDLDAVVNGNFESHTIAWEHVLRKLQARQMPPAGEYRPREETYEAATRQLSQSLAEAAAKRPHPGRTDTFRRMNRFEYQNAIRDLLDLEIDATTLLPADESSNGFDNITVGDLPPTLLTRYVDAAQKISRLAIGSSNGALVGHIYRIAPDVTQEQHVQGLPFGTRGGSLLHHTFPADGEYEVHVRLARDRNEHVEGLNQQYQLDFLLDRNCVASFEIEPPQNNRNYFFDDEQLRAKIRITAGPHDLGVTFAKNRSSLLETKRQPLNVHFNSHRHPRLTPAVYQISITGPYPSESVAASEQETSSTASRDRIFFCYPANSAEEEECARKIIGHLARRAYRQPVGESELAGPMQFYRRAALEDGFEGGIESALSSILVSPRFLFRIEKDPQGLEAGSVYRISDLALASRLSFFLWSSIPDEELLRAAEQNRLHDPDVLARQVRRMLNDPRCIALVTNFANQWLYLRNLDSRTPDARLFPDFDDNLRQAMRRETELFVKSIMQQDRSVLDLIRADYTFLNERLAKHYGIPHIYGSRFRRVELAKDSHRGGLLRHGSILTLSSYATRTSPVIRGNWILVNILGTPTPPPPPDVPSLDDVVIGAELSIAERLAAHRANPACASCHNIMDPIGFALENYDAVGRWREHELGNPVEAVGKLSDGTNVEGVAGLEANILRRPELFVSAMTEKLMTYALGRGIELSDGPSVRGVVAAAAKDDYRFSAVVLAIVNSPAFQMRISQ